MSETTPDAVPAAAPKPQAIEAPAEWHVWPRETVVSGAEALRALKGG